MLHTFTATAYEIAEFSVENLIDKGLIKIDDLSNEITGWRTVILEDAQDRYEVQDSTFGVNILHSVPATSARFEGMLPGDQIKITLDEQGDNNSFVVVIGATGNYLIELQSNIEILSIQLNKNNSQRGTLTYSYYADIQSEFDRISNVEIYDVVEQFFGDDLGIVDRIQDIRTKLYDIYYIRAYLKEVLPEPINPDDRDKNNPHYLYRNSNNEVNDYYIGETYGYNNGSITRDNGTMSCLYLYKDIDGNPRMDCSIDLTEIKMWTMKNLDITDDLFIAGDPNVIIEIIYQKRVEEYVFENNTDKYPELVTAKKDYEEAQRAFDNAVLEGADTVSYWKARCEMAYDVYILKLTDALEKEKEAQGDVS